MLTADDLQFFNVIRGAASLAAAARLLNVSPPAVTQRLRGLEERLGVHLVDRSSKRISLTDEGELLAERSIKIIAEIDDVADLLDARRGMVTGHLRIAAPSGFGRRYVAPAITSFRQAHPDVRITLDLSDNPIRLKPDAWDIIIHIGELRSLPFQMVTLAPNRRILCASPNYLDRRGAPEKPADLLDHACLALRENDEDVTLWRLTRTGGSPESVRVNAKVSCNNGDVIHDWALAGFGIILRSEWDVAHDVTQGRLIRLLTDWSPPDAPIVALLGPRNHRAARVRHFIDALRGSLHPVPWRLENNQMD